MNEPYWLSPVPEFRRSMETKSIDRGASTVWGKGRIRRLSKLAGIDQRQIDKLREPISIPAISSLQSHLSTIRSTIERLDNELRAKESSKKGYLIRLRKLQCISDGIHHTLSMSDAASSQETLVRIWEENRKLHQEADRKLLYPGHDTLSHEISTTPILHTTLVDYHKQHRFYVPAIAKKVRSHYLHCLKVARRFKRLQEKWKQTHHEDEESVASNAGRGWKEEGEKRDKRSTPTRSMSRITRSQTNNMVECESVTSRDPEYFATRQADVYHITQEKVHYTYINHNGKLTTDGKPMRCQDIPRNQPCPRHCNCPYAVNEEEKRMRPWTDMEKFIFLNGFFNRPKDFDYIASTLTNRSVQDVISFYYLHKRGMYTKLLLRVQLSMWKNNNTDSRPLILAAAYGIGLPIPEDVLGPHYGDINIGDYIHDDRVDLLNSKQVKPDDEILLHQPGYLFRMEDNRHITPAILQARRAEREKVIERLLVRMGVDLKHCIPTEEKPLDFKLEHPSLSTKEKGKLFRSLVESSDEESSPKRLLVDSMGNKKKVHKKEDEDYS